MKDVIYSIANSWNEVKVNFSATLGVKFLKKYIESDIDNECYLPRTKPVYKLHSCKNMDVSEIARSSSIAESV